MIDDIKIGRCPFGGSGEILYKLNEDGSIYGKCTLAAEVRSQTGCDCWSYNEFRSTKSSAGCPRPHENSCRYGYGTWQRQ